MDSEIIIMIIITDHQHYGYNEEEEEEEKEDKSNFHAKIDTDDILTELQSRNIYKEAL